MSVRRTVIVIAAASILAVGCVHKPAPPVNTVPTATAPSEAAPETPTPAPTVEPAPVPEGTAESALPEPVETRPEDAVTEPSPEPEAAAPEATEPEAAPSEEASEPVEAATPSEQPPVATSPLDVLEQVAAPEAALAKFRGFWLGMPIEVWARKAMGPKPVEANAATGEANVATPETGLPSAPRIASKPVYRSLPLVVVEPGVERFVYNDPADIGIDHITFRFFQDKMDAMDVYFRTGFFSNVILDDFLKKIKEIYGDPKSEDWKKQNWRGTLTWDDGTYSVALEIYSGRPFSMKFTQPEVLKAEKTYAETKKKEGSDLKVEQLKF